MGVHSSFNMNKDVMHMTIGDTVPSNILSTNFGMLILSQFIGLFEKVVFKQKRSLHSTPSTIVFDAHYAQNYISVCHFTFKTCFYENDTKEFLVQCDIVKDVIQILWHILLAIDTFFVEISFLVVYCTVISVAQIRDKWHRKKS